MWSFLLLYYLLFDICLSYPEEISTTVADTPEDGKSNPYPNNIKYFYVSEDIDDIKLNYTVPWNIFIAMLMQESFDQLRSIQHNINTIYQLSNVELSILNTTFNSSEDELETLILKKHKSIVKQNKFNATKEFMLDFVDITITFIKKVVAYNLDSAKGLMDAPTTWFKEKLRNKILRQQAKNSSNYIRFRVCKVLSLCRNKRKYSDYVMEWVRHVIALSEDQLKEFFDIVPKVIQKYSDFIESNLKFRQTLKYISGSPEMVQRDTLDYLDEVIAKRHRIYKMMPEPLRNGARYFTQLFNLLDQYYILNEENSNELTDISEILSLWKIQDINVSYVIGTIIENLKLHFVDWPVDVRERIENIWYQITVL